MSSGKQGETLADIQDGTVDLRPCRLSTRKRKLLSVQYLTNDRGQDPAIDPIFRVFRVFRG